MASNSQQSFAGWTEREPAKGGAAETAALDAIGSSASDSAVRDVDVPATALVDEPVDSPSIDISGWNVYVVDSHSLIFQVFHAIPEMTSPRGEPVAAVFGFTRDILLMIEQKKPDYLFCAFDRSGPTFRDEMFDRYKADRTAMPDDLVGRFRRSSRCSRRWRFRCSEWQGYEADDILATVAKHCDAAGECCSSPATRIAGN